MSVVTSYTVTTVAAYRASDFRRVLRLSAEQLASKMIDYCIHLELELWPPGTALILSRMQQQAHQKSRMKRI